MNPLSFYWALWAHGLWLGWSMSWHTWGALPCAGGMNADQIEKWRQLRRISANLRHTAKLIDAVCANEHILAEKKSVSDVLRAMADGFDELKPTVEPDEQETGVVLSIETGERLS